MTIILDGRKVRDIIALRLTEKVSHFSRKPTLAIIQVGASDESSAYIRQKQLFAEKIGCAVRHVQFQADASESEIIKTIGELNTDTHIDGIIVQIPIPKDLDQEKIIASIHPSKDVDGLHPENLKLLWENKSGGFLPATTKGILSLLDFYQIPIEGKKVVVVGRSSLVGKPTALAFLNRNATVAICHSKTANLSQETKTAVILIVAVGKSEFITGEHVSSGAVVVDVGINATGGEKLENEIPERRLVGDVKFEEVKEKAGAITPVPGGVGPMTVASLFENLVLAFEKNIN